MAGQLLSHFEGSPSPTAGLMWNKMFTLKTHDRIDYVEPGFKHIRSSSGRVRSDVWNLWRTSFSAPDRRNRAQQVSNLL